MWKGFLISAMIGTVLAGAIPAIAVNRDQREAPKKEKLICKSQKVTGSRTKVNRTCLTKKQWDDIAATAKKGLDEMGRSASSSGVCRFEDPNRTSPCF